MILSEKFGTNTAITLSSLIFLTQWEAKTLHDWRITSAALTIDSLHYSKSVWRYPFTVVYCSLLKAAKYCVKNLPPHGFETAFAGVCLLGKHRPAALLTWSLLVVIGMWEPDDCQYDFEREIRWILLHEQCCIHYIYNGLAFIDVYRSLNHSEFKCLIVQILHSLT